MNQGHLESNLCPIKTNNFFHLNSYFPGLENLEEEDAELLKLTDPKDIHVPLSYRGPHIKFPLSMNQVECLIDAFKKKQVSRPCCIKKVILNMN